MAQLPPAFANLATQLNLPYEYYSAILYNGALRLRSKYQISSFPGDQLPQIAKNTPATLRGANTAIARLQVTKLPIVLFQYNIFADRFY